MQYLHTEKSNNINIYNIYIFYIIYIHPILTSSDIFVIISGYEIPSPTLLTT